MTLALAFAALVSCSKENEEIDQNAPVEIKMNAKTLSVIARSVVDQGTAFDPTIITSKVDGNYTTDNILWTSDVKVAADGAITFTSKQYYPTDRSDIYMKGFHPQATATNGKVSYEIDGKKDIMVSNQVTGNSQNPNETSLAFTHLLTQIKFMVKGENVPADMTVQTITLKKVATKADLDITTGSLTYTTVESEIIDLAVEIGNQAPLTATAAAAGIIMVSPQATYTIDITTSNGTFSNIEIKPSSGDFMISSSHVITLTFKANEVSSNASAGIWTPGTSGGSTIQ